MQYVLDKYHAISFRGRLLLLLVAVAAVQTSVAAYTFFELQARPAEQRVQAQLSAAMRAVAPIIDEQIKSSSNRLRELKDDPALQSAIETEDWAQVESILGSDASLIEDTSISTDGLAADGFEQDEGASLAGEDQTSTRPLAYVTDASGEVVAGSRPDGVLVNQPGVTSTRLLRSSKLVATVNVPVVVDAKFIQDTLAPYVPEGVDVFVADDDHLVAGGDNAADLVSRPKGLREGLHEVKIGDESSLALTQPLLDGSVLVGASIPAKKATAMKREGLSSLWGFIIVLAVIMLAVAWFITRAVADALSKFAQIAKDLAGGQLNRRIPITGEDEIAVLGSSLNEMAENLEERIESLVAARASMRRQVELFGDALANATDVEEMLQAVCSLAMESTSATHARFWTIDEDGRFDHAACIGLRPNDTEPCGLEREVPVRNVSIRSEQDPAWLVIPSRLRDGQIVGILTLVSTTDAFSDDDLKTGERIALQAAVAIDNARMHEQLRLQATRDGLTGLPNHRSLQVELSRKVAEAYASGIPLGVCLLDIDNFKRVNDTYGHQIGDEAIKAIGRTLAHGVGGMGVVGRYGGEEFVVIMPGCDADASCRIADRLREDIERIEVPLEDGSMLRITSSFGVSNVDQQPADSQIDHTGLLYQADIGLYNAKRTGKNRVYLAGPDTVVIEMSEVEKAKLAARERGDAAAEQVAASKMQADPFDLAA